MRRSHAWLLKHNLMGIGGLLAYIGFASVLPPALLCVTFGPSAPRPGAVSLPGGIRSLAISFGARNREWEIATMCPGRPYMLGGGTPLQRALPPSAVLAQHLQGVGTATSAAACWMRG